ncbi:ribosome maturation factor RimM [Sediminicurvatus halobius]|uniref:Ribosome maturation factor RimM n=1 Tax=Sediminicurvatus halobius TaxID=2182432 RepID=A0A2U2N6K8_9GAMM|nr:ribosome maturation factor RimM [Spiribacter halobius]PWG64609.1 ribosome maturation factor RimM [Spiribacter halobius]UEX79068.1 ribosome maturation factor RimM [Spiribacter halobius]
MVDVQADDERIVLGEIVGVHGVGGRVKVHSWTRPPENLFDYRDWELQLAGTVTPVRLVEGRRQGRHLLARIEGLSDRDAALAWRGARIAVPSSALPPAGAGEYYWAELEGLEVVTREGQVLGQVDHLLETGANDVLVVRGERERLVPYVPGTYVLEVDLAAARITVDWDPEF